MGSPWYATTKAVIDRALVVLLLPAALPLMALAVAAMRLTSAGPGIYTQTRAGLNGRPFRIFKIRTMVHRCEERSGIRWSQKGDPRVTRVGKFLRATHIDELPQLFNVLFGQMSLVGPRPERPEVIAALGLDQLVPGYRQRLRVRPGVTGLAQIQLPPDHDVASVRRKVACDLYYIRNQGVLLDVRVLAATLFKAVGVGPNLLRRLFFLPGRPVAGWAVAREADRRGSIPAVDMTCHPHLCS